MKTALAVSFGDVAAAAQRLHGVAHRTPVATSRTLDARTGASVFLKCENLQRMGAFKFRGAYNRIAQLTPAERAGGVVAFSSGNHAQGVALAARIVGVAATIVMPDDAPRSKIEATRDYGAEIVFYDRATMNRGAIAARLAAESGATIVPPYDDERIIAGAGTAALELVSDVPDLDVLLVCTGGGGFLSGSAIAATHVRPRLRAYGVEPEAGDDFALSFAQGRRVTIPVPETIADGQRTTAPGELTFPIVRALCAGILLASDAEIEAAMRFAFERLKLVLEPSGACALAALLAGRVPASAGARIGVMLSGGNVDGALFSRVLSKS